MKTLEEQLLLLKESITQTAYHASNIIEAVEMLKLNYFKLRHVSTSELHHNPVNTEKYPYYMSLARSVTSSFIGGSMNSNFRIIIEFDGEKLSQNYKGKAVDWFANEPKEFYQDETEDRLYSKKPTIPNIKKYIKAIHVSSTVIKHRGFYFKELQNMERSFPIYIYNNSEDMLTLRRNKAEKV